MPGCTVSVLWAKVALNFEHFELRNSLRLPGSYLRKGPVPMLMPLGSMSDLKGDRRWGGDSSTMHVILRGLRDPVLTIYSSPRLGSFLPQQPCQGTVFFSFIFKNRKFMTPQTSFQTWKISCDFEIQSIFKKFNPKVWGLTPCNYKEKVMLIMSFK